jgi:hypothetical protein
MRQHFARLVIVAGLLAATTTGCDRRLGLGDPAARPSATAEAESAPAQRVRGSAAPLLSPTPDALTAQLRSRAPTRDMADLAVRMGRATGPVPLTVDGPPAVYREGDRSTFWVHDIQSEHYFQVAATLRVITDAAYFWVQDDQEFDVERLRQGAATFSDAVRPAVRAVFGQEWSPGVDDDARVHLLHHQPIGGVAGYFSSTDEFTTAVEPYSNEREMFYVNLAVHEPGSFDYLSLLAHEYQHMIHWHADRGEAVWVNEGLSELATLVAGYQQQFGEAFLEQPDTALLEWETNPGANAPHYAAAFLFFAYLRAHYGDEVIRAIVASPKTGAAGIEDGLAAVGVSRSFDDVFQDWAVANVVDDAVRAEGRFGYAENNIDHAVPAELAEAGLSTTVEQYATDYYDLTPWVADGRLRLSFAGDERVGLLDAVDGSNGAVWWSGRNDNGDSRLTRKFDLRGASAPELSYRVWHNLEENWDYAYILASTDEGRTWTRLAPPGITDANPNGNGYGQGLTGASPGWVTHRLDLKPYAGQEVLLRFEVVTDDAVSLAGMALDDIQVTGTDFQDSADADVGWNAEGWVRVDPQLPQRWSLQAILDHPGGLEVKRIPTGPDGRAEVRLDEVPGDAKVTLAVSGLTPGTPHGAGYRLAPAATDP